jgi:hypothetical protein
LRAQEYISDLEGGWHLLRETTGYSLMGYVWEAGVDGEHWDQRCKDMSISFKIKAECKTRI